MSDSFPGGWRAAKLSELGELVKARGGSKEDESVDGVPVVRYGEIYTRHDTTIRSFYSFVRPELASNYTKIQTGDVLFAGSGETLEDIGRAAVYLGNDEAHASGDIVILRPNRHVDPLFLGYAANARSAVEQKMRLGQGGAIFHIHADQLAQMSVSMPTLAEQKKIAAILSSIDEAILATQAVIEQTRRVKEGILQDLLTRGIGHTRFSETEVGVVPETWRMMSLGEVADVERGKFSHRPRNAPHLYGGRYPFVQTGDITAAGDLLVRHTQTLNDEGLSYSRMFPTGTILMTIAANIGEVALTTYEVACPDSVVGIIAKKVDSLWLLYALQHQREGLDRKAAQNAQKNINLETLRPLRLAIPPKDEQSKIRDIVRASAIAVENAERENAQLLRTKAGLLDDLLTGRVRVST